MAESNQTKRGNRFQDVSGKKFGRLLVIGLSDMSPGRGEARWLCKCQCGNYRIVRGGHLRSGHTGSCGCQHAEMRTSGFRLSHGYANSRLYGRWKAMIQRCHNPNSVSYIDYGARGIRVCKRWMLFANFLEDMGEPPTARHQLDRFPNPNGDYKPGNVRWATPEENQRNKRSNRLLTFDGQTLCVAAWSEKTGISQTTIRFRLKSGWPIERILSEIPTS